MPARSTSKLLLILLVLATTVLGTGCGDDGGGDSSKAEPGGDRDRGAARSTTSQPTATTPPKLRLREVGRFDAPIHALAVPGTDLVAVVEKGGRVLVAAHMTCAARDNCPRSPVERGDVMLDIAGSVSTGSEQGLLGMAFHPRWPDDPRIFIDYTDDDGDTRIESWTLESPTATARREQELLRIEQPYDNHNGGHLTFGPDGLLYIAMGDGGAAGDPEDRAQEPQERLGKLLRLDVDGGGERGYSIPEGNLSDGAPEVWALGLRNPWRFSFDAVTGDLWIGDVGQDEHEEINALTRDQLAAAAPTPNFEWRQREGFDEFDSSGDTGPGRRIGPVLDYGRNEGCSVTGGIVYRGQLIPKLRGYYVFADFCGDDLRLVRSDGVPGSAPKRGEVTWTSMPGTEQVASFGEVQRGELLVVSLSGSIHQVVPA